MYWKSHHRARRLSLTNYTSLMTNAGCLDQDAELRESFSKFWNAEVVRIKEIHDKKISFQSNGTKYIIESDHIYSLFPQLLTKLLRESDKLPMPMLKMNSVYRESVCDPYCDKIDFIICQSLQHFWVIFDMNNTSEGVDSLMRSGKIRSLVKSDLQNRKWDILRRSQLLHLKCCYFYDLRPDPDDGFFVPFVRSGGDCGVDVVRHILMVYEAIDESFPKFSTMPEPQAIKFLRELLIKSPPRVQERGEEDKMTAITEDDTGERAL